jgi:hypothetical protein
MTMKASQAKIAPPLSQSTKGTAAPIGSQTQTSPTQFFFWLAFVTLLVSVIGWQHSFFNFTLILPTSNQAIESVITSQEHLTLICSLILIPILWLLKLAHRKNSERTPRLTLFMANKPLTRMAVMACALWLMTWAMNTTWMACFLHHYYQLSAAFYHQLHSIFALSFVLSAILLTAYYLLTQSFSGLLNMLLALAVATSTLILYIPDLTKPTLLLCYAILGGCAALNVLLFAVVVKHSNSCQLLGNSLWYLSVMLLASIPMLTIHWLIDRVYLQHFQYGPLLLHANFHLALALIPIFLFIALALSFYTHNRESEESYW